MSEHAATAAEITPPTPRQIRRIAVAAYVGTALEWYDFFLFGATASIVFAPLFFPGGDPALATINALLTFAVGFLARPIGAIVFGHYGDKLGRRGALLVTISMMGVATTLIGVLPDYRTVGITAPILLAILRAAQGFAAGGEWGGATLLALEYAPAKRRGFYAAIVQLGSPTGTLLSSIFVAVMVAVAGNAGFLQWAWRVPYLVSIVLVLVAVWFRFQVEETPVFRALAAQNRTEKAPVVELLRVAPGRLLVGVCAYLFSSAGFFILTTFMISYVTTGLHRPAPVILNALSVSAVVQIVVTLISGRVADRFGAANTVIVGWTFATLMAFPMFWIVNTGIDPLITFVYGALIGVSAIAYAPIGALLAQLFPARLHYSGLGLSSNVAGVVAGFMPAAAAAVFAATGGSYVGPAALLMLVGAISVAGAVAARRLIRRHGDGNAEVVIDAAGAHTQTAIS